MKSRYLFLIAAFGLIIYQSCTSSKKATAPSLSAVSYDKDIKPIMIAHCTPCHFPDEGKKKYLDTYNAVANNIDDILKRVQMPQDEKGFMPFQLKKPALSADQIALFETWKSSGMAE
ncbi:hypothetical protein [Algoriphagus sp.]|uniref:hypothetical protein n=1 Tax=Algoriphagus sp. TaxID=1872435 RepID=UPI0025E57C1C|nr:hypothetical protein [Algoriphagus sp.]